MNKDSKIKIYVVGGDTEYANWMLNHELVDSIEESDLVVFTGGEDVSPVLYGADKHVTTYNNPERDKYEVEEYKKAKALDKPCLGCCRGAQFLAVMSGSKLIQHQENKAARHPIKTYDDKTIWVTSTHHQNQYPFNLNTDDYRVLGWVEGNYRSDFHKGGNDEELDTPIEIDIAYYVKTKCLAIQNHPEFVYPPTSDRDKDMIEYMRELLVKLMNNELETIKVNEEVENK